MGGRRAEFVPLPAQDWETAYPPMTSVLGHQEAAVPQDAGVPGSVWLNLQAFPQRRI